MGAKSRNPADWNPHQLLMEAGRGAIIGQKKAVREQAIAQGMKVATEIHHASPDKFTFIMKDWIKRENIKPTTDMFAWTKQGRVWFKDDKLNKSFADYHEMRAHMVALTHENHLKIHDEERRLANMLASKQIKNADLEASKMLREFEYRTVQQQDKVFGTKLYEALLEKDQAMALRYSQAGNFVMNPDQFYRAAYDGSGRLLYDALNNESGIHMVFNMRNPEAEAWIKAKSLGLVRDINNTQRKVISGVIADGMKEGDTVQQIANRIKNSLPLDERRARALLNYEKTLRGSGLGETQIQGKLRAYSNFLKTDRAKSITLTEMHTATAEANWDGIKQARAEGRLKNHELEWLTAPDERRCPTCGAMHGKKANIDEGFKVPLPLHPRCRCRIIVVRKKDTANLDVAPAVGDNYKPSSDINPDEIKTTEDAENYLKSILPNAMVDLRGGHPALMRDMSKELGKLVTEYPEVAARLETVGVFDPMQPAWGITDLQTAEGWQMFATSDGKMIAMNRIWVSDPVKWEKSMQRAASMGWHPEGTDHIQGILTHEWGHQVANSWADDAEHILVKYIDTDDFGSVHGTWEAFRKQKLIDPKLAQYPRSYIPNLEVVKDEEWAEGFTAVRHGTGYAQQSNYTKSTKELLEVMDRKNWIPVDQGARLSDLERGSPEYEAADKALNELAKRLGLKREATYSVNPVSVVV